MDENPMASVAARPLVKTRLSFMMFLQYAIWGAWLPILYPFLLGYRHFTLDETGAVLAAGAVGAIFGPFIAGQLADRSVNTEKLLAVSHLCGAILVWFLGSIESFSNFLLMSLLYGLIYAPTLALTNSIAFANLKDRDREFGVVRVWGTVGWIAAGIGVGQLLLHLHTPTGPDASAAAVSLAQDAGRADAFRISAILGVIMAFYCLTLPRTPPAKNPRQPSAWIEALQEVRKQPLITLFLIAVPVSMLHQFYFVHTSQFLTLIQNRNADANQFAASLNQIFGVGGIGLMTVGQMAEVLVLAIMPLVAPRVSRKSLLAIGLAAYAGRMALFAYSTELVPVLIGVALHGLCFGCFIFVAFMVVDEETSEDVRATAQNLFNLVIIGVGIIVGSWFATSVAGRLAMGAPGPDGAPGQMDYTTLFSIPMGMAIICLVALLAAYPGGRSAPATAPPGR